ncbi:MAG: hypothetical protein RLZZ127_2025 [Planctomycetota bacterium]|jgi:hypothetical protein
MIRRASPRGLVASALILAAASCATPRPAPASLPPDQPATDRDGSVVQGRLSTGGELRRIRGDDHPVAVRRIEVDATRPVAVEVPAGADFSPRLVARPLDGDPDEALRWDEMVPATGAARIAIVAARSGPWLVEITDALARDAAYTLRTVPLRERPVLRLDQAVAPTIAGDEAPAVAVFPVTAGRTYRLTLAADGFAVHAVCALPGLAPHRLTGPAATVTAPRGGLAILQIRSHTDAAGTCTIAVDEVWP